MNKYENKINAYKVGVWSGSQGREKGKRVSGSKSCIQSLLCKSQQKKRETTMQLWIPWWSSRNVDFLQELWKRVKLINVRLIFCNFENSSIFKAYERITEFGPGKGFTMPNKLFIFSSSNLRSLLYFSFDFQHTYCLFLWAWNNPAINPYIIHSQFLPFNYIIVLFLFHFVVMLCCPASSIIRLIFHKSLFHSINTAIISNFLFEISISWKSCSEFYVSFSSNNCCLWYHCVNLAILFCA